MSTDPTPRQILLAIDSVQDLMALEAATELATLLRATLEGVFVEDAELLRLAQLPFAYEISLASATARRLESRQLERDLRAQAEQARRLVERHALQHQLTWSFRVERGGVSATLQGHQTLDVAILGRSHRHTALEQQRDGAILVAFDGSPASLRAIETAAPLVAKGTDLLVLLPAANAAALRTLATAKLAELHTVGHYLTLQELSPAALLAAGQRYHCRMLVLSTTTPLSPVQLQLLLAKSSCPIAVVG